MDQFQDDQPVTVIRQVTQVPPINEEIIKEICLEHYGLKPGRIERLNGFDDRNYRLVNVHEERRNENIKTICQHGYVMKIINAEDTAIKNLIEGQNALLRHMKSKGLPVPELVKDKMGDDLIRILVKYETNDNEEITGGVHAVRIMRFIPGQILLRVPADGATFYKIGRLLARLHLALEDFCHPSFGPIPSTLWSLHHAGHIKRVMHVVDDELRRRIVKEVVDAFQENVAPQVHSLEKGQIHGDFNEQNLLMGKTETEELELCGILDMGDSHHTCLIFDVAIGLMYMMMLDSSEVPYMQIGGHFLAGYMAERTIPKRELRLLRICICARYCQSLVYGLHSYSLNPTPDNDYVLTTQRKGWPQLMELWQMTEQEVHETWECVLSTYGIHNVF